MKKKKIRQNTKKLALLLFHKILNHVEIRIFDSQQYNIKALFVEQKLKIVPTFEDALVYALSFSNEEEHPSFTLSVWGTAWKKQFKTEIQNIGHEQWCHCAAFIICFVFLTPQ